MNGILIAVTIPLLYRMVSGSYLLPLLLVPCLPCSFPVALQPFSPSVCRWVQSVLRGIKSRKKYALGLFLTQSNVFRGWVPSAR